MVPLCHFTHGNVASSGNVGLVRKSFRKGAEKP